MAATFAWGNIMKQLIVIIALFVFTLAADAQMEPQKPYSEMTLEELKAVNTQKLPKAAKKAHKKALTAAKKAEKARIKAQKRAAKERKKAEMARKRAEAKRLKAEKKRKAKAQKAVQKKLKKVAKAYRNTKIIADEFSAQIEIEGPMNFTRKGNFSDFLASQPIPKFLLRSFFDPETGHHNLQAYVHHGVSDSNFNSDHLVILGISKEEYARRKGFWQNFSSASLKGGIKRRVHIVRQSGKDCNDIYCYFNEDVVVNLSIDDLTKSLSEKTELAFRLAGRDKSLIIRIPHDYLVGFAWRLSELNSGQSVFATLAEEGKQFILSGAE